MPPGAALFIHLLNSWKSALVQLKLWIWFVPDAVRNLAQDKSSGLEPCTVLFGNRTSRRGLFRHRMYDDQERYFEGVIKFLQDVDTGQIK